MAVIGAVLCGGASRRMGRDKALIEVDGAALAVRVAEALRAGGCDRVLAVGGDGVGLAAVGLDVVPDRWPGEGPLGGLATALAAGDAGDVLVLAPCDWVAASPEVVRRLVAVASPAAHVVVDGRPQWLPSAFRVRAGLAEAVAAVVDGGARRLDAVAELVGGGVGLPVPAAAVADVDTPEDLSRGPI